jgi:hypothetical protein
VRARTLAALGIGAIFIVIGLVYGTLGWNTSGRDAAGAEMLIVLGIAMTFAFAIILRGTRDL